MNSHGQNAFFSIQGNEGKSLQVWLDISTGATVPQSL